MCGDEFALFCHGENQFIVHHQEAAGGFGVTWRHLEAGASGFTYATRGEFTFPNVVPGAIELTITESEDKVVSKSTLSVVAGGCLEYDVELAPARPK